MIVARYLILIIFIIKIYVYFRTLNVKGFAVSLYGYHTDYHFK